MTQNLVLCVRQSRITLRHLVLVKHTGKLQSLLAVREQRGSGMSTRAANPKITFYSLATCLELIYWPNLEEVFVIDILFHSCSRLGSTLIIRIKPL